MLMRNLSSPKVWLSENAFVSLVTATVEAFPDETLGVLVGLQESECNQILVQYAIVYQTAKRTRDQVEPDQKCMIRTDNFLREVTRLHVVGYFHSHPKLNISKKCSAWLSPSDKKAISINSLELVVAIDKDLKMREWKHLPRGSLLGCVFPYSIRIAGWHKENKDEFRICKLHCPFALGLGR
jgi:proteasome lid subunit RPN8/RPN11